MDQLLRARSESSTVVNSTSGPAPLLSSLIKDVPSSGHAYYFTFTLLLFFFNLTFLQYVFTLYRYILAYRSIFCNDIYLMEVCTNEAVQMLQEVCWVQSVAEEAGCVRPHAGFSVVLYKTQLVYRENHSIFFFFSSEFIFFSINKRCSTVHGFLLFFYSFELY